LAFSSETTEEGKRMADDEIRKLQHERRIKSGELAAFGAEQQEDPQAGLVGSIDVGGEVEDYSQSGLASFTGKVINFFNLFERPGRVPTL
jgi:hypothetical protein